MRLYVLSDVHVEFEPFDPPDVKADVVILAGDIHINNKGLAWAQEKFPDKPVLYVFGNHEFYGQALPKHLEKIKQQAFGSNVRVLENESCQFDDVTFLCCTLWTDFSLLGDPRLAGGAAAQVLTDYKKIRVSPTYRRLRSIDTAGIHYESKNWLIGEFEKNVPGKLVVVTHRAPSIKSLHAYDQEDVLNAAYASNLDELVKDSGADLWIHGHIHTQNDYLIGKTRVICNPRGYPDEPNERFISDLVIEI